MKPVNIALCVARACGCNRAANRAVNLKKQLLNYLLQRHRQVQAHKLMHARDGEAGRESEHPTNGKLPSSAEKKNDDSNPTTARSRDRRTDESQPLQEHNIQKDVAPSGDSNANDAEGDKSGQAEKAPTTVAGYEVKAKSAAPTSPMICPENAQRGAIHSPTTAAKKTASCNQFPQSETSPAEAALAESVMHARPGPDVITLHVNMITINAAEASGNIRPPL
eukprot:CAMPEP_0204335142 /NCGR_PEP_ID=MMETSP0469-20131031/18548_1 /ASSEMBLY_ACC=CAM_ASM_000384 /TAXON_ID=2969 /ORGANISM="Oxyrrhis marina" /LENGTH=221 /DNA_ID=CAMNT_0051318759 /DNA_START=737 /DNA_END=1406 /DNA_ORIENTATION=+